MNQGLIDALRDPACYDHETGPIEIVETHISWVILTGPCAYKLKKPVDFGFLDFSTLELRERYCNEELRLNRRLAPMLYLDVVSINGGDQGPRINGDGPVLEWAVRMRQFPPGHLLSDMLANGTLRDRHMDLLAREVARFHATTKVADASTPYGDPAVVHAPVRENFEQIRAVTEDAGLRARLALIEDWSERAYTREQASIARRKADGRIRECHGDLHCGNIVEYQGALLPFDCIEFNDRLRWIDVMSEVAFMFMDLQDHGRRDLAWRFLNAYLEETGDYGGLAVLRYYVVYRAMVRCKVTALRLAQIDGDDAEKRQSRRELENYLTLAEGFVQQSRQALLITHGFSGSGKTYLSQGLLAALPAIRIRSDVERKRLFGLPADADSDSGIAGGLYVEDATERTYQHLATQAGLTLAAGFSAIVDAAFLRQWQRDLLREVARRRAVPFVIVACEASHTLLMQRVSEREARGLDASEANLDVLRHQLEDHDPLTPDEIAAAIVVDTAESGSVARVMDRIGRLWHEPIRWD